MRLKSLDIKGFKSFADKTQVLMDNDVTGIVGPNGCGKSNIVDAIRWVIGEHKIKALRSDHLEDLIFNGTKKRSAAGLAEVSLTFENTRNLLPTEYSTVTITRKFFKSGDSEYRLNDVVCRRKDIQNLFIDTGVSSDSYAIIELGMVDDIIKDKDNSRRRMLEQAAGISIYKTRKKETQRKLEQTQQDIDRIEDILYEIANNMRTLESQAKKAERYLKLKKEYKEISLELARESLKDYNEKYQTLNEQLIKEEDHKTKATAEIADDEAQIESKKTQLTTEEKELAHDQKKFNDLVNSIRQLENEKKLSAQQLKHLEEREQQLKKHLEEAETHQKQLEELRQQAQKNISLVHQDFLALKNKSEYIKTDLSKKKSDFENQRKTLNDKRETLQVIRERKFDIEKKSAVAGNTLANFESNLNRIEKEREKRRKSLKRLAIEKQQLTLSVAEKEKHFYEKQHQRKKIEVEKEDLQNKINKLREIESSKNRNLDARQNEYDLLKSMVDNLEGYPESIKFLKKNKHWHAHAPLLSDLFSVPKDCRVVLEAVLNNYLNYYVVKNEEEAVAAINLLAEHKKGKAGFFLLNKLKQRKTNLPPIPEGFQPILDAVKVEKEYQALAQMLLGRILWTKNDKLIHQTNLPDDYVYSSKSGHLQRQGKSITGGSIGSFEGHKIGRAKNLSGLNKEIATLTQEVTTVKKDKEKQQEKFDKCQTSLKAIDLETARNEWQEKKNELARIQSEIEHLDRLDKEAKQKLERLQQKIESHHKNTSGDTENLNLIEKELKAAKETLQQINQTYSKAEQIFNAAEQKYHQHRLELNNGQNKLDQLKREQQFRDNQEQDLKQQIEQDRKDLSETSEKISATSGKLNFGDNEMDNLLKQKEKEEKALNQRDQAYYKARNEVQLHEQKISRQRKAKEQAETLVNQLKEKISDMKVKVVGLKERLEVEFDVNFEAILQQERTTDFDKETLYQKSEQLKKRLGNMGEVNPTAIEAYGEIKLRHDFIVEQKGDLEDSRDTLLKTIQEIEETANNRLMDTFEQVRENFIKVFKTLFTEEDKADLKLTDPEDLAETGVEITARPKGKRPSTLTQLSGGEKTLTSTAFLFAIYLIKPAPFCILDEVDAPLDDANVGKFTDMIRAFSHNSQFILITHNKQTMASVDVIYGVTMQESGVSKLVPVDFRSLANS